MSTRIHSLNDFLALLKGVIRARDGKYIALCPRHKSALMTMRYLKTLSADESLKIQQAVDFGW